MTISALILAKNEQDLIKDCIKQLDFADEIILLDQNSTDSTLENAKKYATQVLRTKTESFDQCRNILKSAANCDWLLYVDCDERLSLDLKKEIMQLIKSREFSAYYFPRKNYVLGKWLKHGGWWPDYVPKLFQNDCLSKWVGAVHESPQIIGSFGYATTPIEHFTARSISQMLDKTVKWAKIEAELKHKSGHPKVNIFKVIKAMALEFAGRYFLKFGFLDGTIGLIESIFQSLHQAITLTYLWELQNHTKEKFTKIKYE